MISYVPNFIEEVFLEGIPDYQAELDRCGYSHKLAYRQPVVSSSAKEEM